MIQNGNKLLGSPKNERGFTMLEALIGGVLVGIVALGVLPSFVSLVEAQKVTNFKSVCTSYARAKLQEYVNGYGSGTLGYIPSGYEYTKARYKTGATANTGYCNSPTAGAPGWREYITSDTIVAQNASNDSAVPSKYQGFQLYVLIKNLNFRDLDPTTSLPTRTCPAASYNFFARGEAFEVTVTGMIRTSPLITESGRSLPGEPAQSFGGLYDYDASTPNPMLTCTVSQIIYPPRIPFRYYLGIDGKIRNYQVGNQSSSTNSLEEMESHFRSLWSTSTTSYDLSSPVIANIQSFAISPDNTSAYILKPGELSLYKNCTSTNTVTSTSPAYTFTGVPDCSATPSTTWQLNGNVDNITVNFGDILTGASPESDDRVFGFFSSGTTDGAATDARISVLDTTNSLWIDPTASENFELPQGYPRIRGVFLSQPFPAVTKPTMFFFDNTCYQSPDASVTGWIYCTTIFTSSDTSQNYQVREIPVQAQSISY